MRTSSKLFCAAAMAASMATGAAAQQANRVGDRDDQVVIRGCVMKAGPKNTSGPRTILVWSRGDVYLDSAVIQTRPADGNPATRREEPIFYWIDDEDDLAKHAGKRVEIVGELSERLKKGEIEIDHGEEYTEIELKWGGKDVTARVPTAWLGPAPRKDSEFDLMVRTVDVEKVNVLAESCK